MTKTTHLIRFELSPNKLLAFGDILLVLALAYIAFGFYPAEINIFFSGIATGSAYVLFLVYFFYRTKSFVSNLWRG
jgi:hypothetical protein